MSKKNVALLSGALFMLTSVTASAHRLIDPVAAGWGNFVQWLFG